MTRLLGLTVAVALTAGCAAAGGPPASSDSPRRDLAARPSPLPVATGGTAPAATVSTPGSSPATSPGATAGGSTPGSGPARSGPGGGGTGSTPAAPFHPFVTMNDGAGDAGLGAPAYADLRVVTLADNGTSLQVTVEMNGPLPTATASGESMGIGVDLYRAAAQRESDYQLFADGEPDGWFAYLDTPRGFVRYPGTFALGGRTLVFTVPWSSVGNPRTGRTSAFADWTRRSSAATGNPSSNDYVPTLGTTSYTR
jgi:hypothetical protein